MKFKKSQPHGSAQASFITDHLHRWTRHCRSAEDQLRRFLLAFALGSDSDMTIEVHCYQFVVTTFAW